jgi:hypothetical protein
MNKLRIKYFIQKNISWVGLYGAIIFLKFRTPEVFNIGRIQIFQRTTILKGLNKFMCGRYLRMVMNNPGIYAGDKEKFKNGL